MAIKTHIELATFIQNKSILHLNSLGKDSVLCLHWLSKFAKPKRIVSLYCRIDAAYPTDDKYLEFLKQKYQNVEFIEATNAFEMSDVITGVYQDPAIVNHVLNNSEYYDFDHKTQVEQIRQKYNLDYLCSGVSKYEGMGRAIFLNRNGLVHEKTKTIFPIGLMSKEQVIKLLKDLNIGLNPCYKTGPRTYDHPSFYKMKLAFDCLPEYKKIMFNKYPLLRLDEYRFERLFNEKRT